MPRAAKTDTKGLLDKFDSFLQRKSLKLTAQRRRIVEQILGMEKTHFGADDLLDQFRDERPRVSKATIYRALGVLVEAGILEQHDFGESHRLFELSEGRDHHDHLMCTRCGTIIEFHSEEMEALQDKVAARLGFHPTHHSQKIFGICKDCWKQGKR
ncbi:MAG: transcriptional repressor [Planctomycetes bacterium]|jgi:Fur family ferric uptake transcriptional regulator|nr:transcriptional repressor [Planctomycetota bacterium]MCL4729430.1 transcriptional repressor [Planctomycetota bacterium]